MAFTIDYRGDATEILDTALRRCLKGGYVVTVTAREDATLTDSYTYWSGPVIAVDELGAFTIAEWDDEDQATGGERTFELSDVIELVIH